jgi:VCBS repeat
VRSTSTAADAESGLANIIFASPSVATGWTGTPAFTNTDTTSPFTQADGWISTAGSGTQAVTSTNGTGATALTTLTLTADSTAPTLSFTTPAAGTTIQTSTTVNVAWTETEAGSGVASRSLQRQKGTVVTPGGCVGVTYSNDGSADTGASPRSNTSLVSGQCYVWIQTLTDNVGNVSSATTSGAELINGAPTAVADSYTTNEDVTLSVPVTGTPYNGVVFNDTDPENNSLTAVLVSDVATGTLGLNADGSFTYVPVANASGSVTFTYKANDGGLDSNTVTVTITITSVNDAPSFTKGANQTVLENAGAQSLSSWATSLSTGPANESGQVLDFIVSNNYNGLFSVQPAVSATGTLSYTPAANASGSTTVTVQIHDDGGTANGGVNTSAAQTFVITVSDGAFTSSSGWPTTFDSTHYLKLTFPAYVPAGSVVSGATFRHEYRSAIAGDTTCYYFEVYSGATLLATHGSAGTPVSCNATTSYASDAVALPEVDTVAEANNVSIKLFVKNSGGRASQHRIATLGITSSLD